MKATARFPAIRRGISGRGRHGTGRPGHCSPDLTLAPGQSGYVQVLNSYTGAGPSDIASTAFQFQIMPLGSNFVAFTNSPTDPSMDLTVQSSSYVFAGFTANALPQPNSGRPGKRPQPWYSRHEFTLQSGQ